MWAANKTSYKSWTITGAKCYIHIKPNTVYYQNMTFALVAQKLQELCNKMSCNYFTYRIATFWWYLHQNVSSRREGLQCVIQEEEEDNHQASAKHGAAWEVHCGILFVTLHRELQRALDSTARSGGMGEPSFTSSHEQVTQRNAVKQK